MCMLTYLPPRTQPDVEALYNGAFIHTDGHGYAIVVPGKKPRLIVHHGMDPEEVIESFIKARKKYSTGPALFHSRWGTSGSMDSFNCHPFQIDGDSRTVVAHNGVLPNYMQPHKHDRRCDTRLAADQMFGQWYGELTLPESREKLADAIGANNKLVILTIDPAYDSWAYIINEDSGTWDGDIWYSNHDYLGHTSYGTGWSSWDADDEEDTRVTSINYCPVCKSIGGVDLEYQYCEMCNTCLDCFTDLTECTCYIPSNLLYNAKRDETEDVEDVAKLLNSGE